MGKRNFRKPPPAITAASIGTSDSGGGAGMQADLLTFAAHGLHGVSVVVAATAQDSLGIAAVEPISPGFIAKQIDAVFPDFRPRAARIGALFDEPRIRAVASGLRRHGAPGVVLDPVLASKAGDRLLARSALPALRRIFPLCTLVTPNIPEAEALAGMRIRSDSDRRLAAGLIADMGSAAVLLKGGHARSAEVRDLLFDGRVFTEFVAPRIRTRATHGTGCTLAAAIAAHLALGRNLEEAVLFAIRYLRAGLERGRFPGRGHGVPDHFPPGSVRKPGR
jgi:hydroxymethylpyrimidine kinase/phosphomethylpyrimidine kinase